jgi:hypothetical protein
MMSVIGDPSRFAVEYALAANHGGVWMYGHFCYWCDGQRVGDYELGTSLRDVLFQLDELAKYSRRINRRFNATPAASVFRTIDGALFGEAEPSAVQLAEDEQWSRHSVFPPVDVFDDWKGFLVGDGAIERLICARHPYSEVTELTLANGEVDSVLSDLRRELNAIHEWELDESRGASESE